MAHGHTHQFLRIIELDINIPIIASEKLSDSFLLVVAIARNCGCDPS